MADEITTTITFADGDQITSAKLNQIISGASFGTGAVTGTTLTVTGGKLKVGTLTSSELGTGCVTATQIAANAVTENRILDGNVTADKIADLAVTGSKIAVGNIRFDHVSATYLATQPTMESESGGVFVTPVGVKFALTTAKAFGEFDIATSSRAIKSNSYNITSLTRVDSTHTTVTLNRDMNSANYTVMATFVSTGTAEIQAVSVYNKAAGSFSIMHPAESAGRAVNFVVFGTYT